MSLSNLLITLDFHEEAALKPLAEGDEKGDLYDLCHGRNPS